MLASYQDTADVDGQVLVLAQPLTVQHPGQAPNEVEAQVLVVPGPRIAAVYVTRSREPDA